MLPVNQQVPVTTVAPGSGVTAPPDPARRLRQVFFLVAASILGDSALYAVLPVYALERGIPLFWVGVILSINRVIRLLTNPLAARLQQHTGARLVFPLAMATAAATTAVYGLASDLALLLVARMFWGFTWSALRLAGFDLVAGWAPAQEQGWWMGRFRSTFRMGSLVASLTAGLMADKWGFPTPFVVFSVISGIGALVAYSLRHRLFAMPESPVQAAGPGQLAAAGKPGERTGTKNKPSWPVLALGLMVALVSEGLVPSTLGYLVVTQLGSPINILGITTGAATFSGFLLSFRWISDLVLAPAAGKLSDRRGVAQTAGFIYVSAAILLPVLLFLTQPWLFALTAMVLFAGLSGAITMSEVVAIRTTGGQDRLKHLSLYATAADSGSALGPLSGYALGAGIGIVPVYILGTILLTASLVLTRRAVA